MSFEFSLSLGVNRARLSDVSWEVISEEGSPIGKSPATSWQLLNPRNHQVPQSFRVQNISELLLQRQNSSGYQAKQILSKYLSYVTLMQKFIICFYIKHCSIQYMYHFWAVQHIVLVRVIKQRLMTDEHCVILKEYFCVYFTGYYKVDYLCLTDGMVLTFIV